MKVSSVIVEFRDADSCETMKITIKQNSMVSDIEEGQNIPVNDIVIERGTEIFNFSIDGKDTEILIEALMLRQYNRSM